MDNRNGISESRRNFLRVGAAGAGALALGAMSNGTAPLASKLAKAAPMPNLKRLVIVNMLGGCDGLNLLYPATGSVASIYATRRPTLGFAQGQGLSLTGGPGVSEFELHPSMANLQARWNANQVAFVNKVGYPNKNLSHFVSEDVWSYGARNGMSSLGSLAPGWVARYGNAYASTQMGLASIGVGRRLDFEGATSNPFLVSSVSSFRYDIDYHYSRNHELRRQVIENILAMQPATGTKGQVAAAAEAAYIAEAQMTQAITDYETYETNNSIQYPLRAGSTTSLTTMGRRLRDVALLIYGGFETEIYYTGYGGFDTHADQAARQTSLFSEFDDALGVFFQDLTTQGVWNDTVVLVISEFGRRNYENGSDGTDHGHANVMTAIGGPVNGGIHGNPLVDADLNAEYLPYSTDFRDVYRNLIQGHLGNDPTPLFPETQPINSTINVV
jgi:uncharacterized protein (DUF1501 family)